MRILAIGDFHGRFPGKINKIIQKDKIDLVVSNGDYPPFAYRKLWFKHCYGKDVDLSEVIGKARYKKLVLDDLNKGEIALKGLNNLSIPVFTVLGNMDWPMPDDITDKKLKKENMPSWDRKDSFAKRINNYKNIKRIDYSFAKFGDYIFIGMRGHSAPGKTQSKAFRKHKKILDNLFKKFNKENKNHKVIFVSHNVPYNTKLDKITSKEAPKEVRGKHYGSKLCKKIIKSYQPVLAIGGHIHESWGKQNLGKTLCVNPGAVHEGKYCIVDIGEGKVKAKFMK